jgi:dTDP-4-dehydrorhamnose 3,5-epimerase
MKIEPRKLEGCFEITLTRRTDVRGYFERTYCRRSFAEAGLQVNWVQENQSFSQLANTVRGLHFQVPPHSETKLVRVVTGSVLDVFVDLRKSSSTYGRWDSIELSSDNDKMIYIPAGFAHGFRTLTDNVTVQYKVDSEYSPDSEGGIMWNDPTLGVEWGIAEPVLSERDKSLPAWSEFTSPF